MVLIICLCGKGQIDIVRTGSHMAEVHGVDIVEVGVEVDVQWELMGGIVEVEEFVHGFLVDGCHLEGAGPELKWEGAVSKQSSVQCSAAR